MDGTRPTHTMLGLGDGSPVSEVKRAFRARAFACHPDRGGDPAQFRQLVREYRAARRTARPVPRPPRAHPFLTPDRLIGSASVVPAPTPRRRPAPRPGTPTLAFADVLAAAIARAA